MSTAEREAFERAAWDFVHRTVVSAANDSPDLSEWADQNGYTVIDAPPAASSRRSFTYVTPSGDIETSVIDLGGVGEAD